MKTSLGILLLLLCHSSFAFSQTSTSKDKPRKDSLTVEDAADSSHAGMGPGV
jgi:hypothetical protein